MLGQWGQPQGGAWVSVFTGLQPWYWGEAGVALWSALDLGPQCASCVLLDSASSGHRGHWLCALAWPPTKSGGKELRMLSLSATMAGAGGHQEAWWEHSATL